MGSCQQESHLQCKPLVLIFIKHMSVCVSVFMFCFPGSMDPWLILVCLCLSPVLPLVFNSNLLVLDLI